MRIAYITAGAAGMFCGSCMRDNTLAAELIAQGHDALLIPTYTPIRTDEDDVSEKRVFFGGINVYLQEKFSLFRHTPRAFDWLLDRRWLLEVAGRYGSDTPPSKLGPLTLDVLEGERGPAIKELRRLLQFVLSTPRDRVKYTNLNLQRPNFEEIEKYAKKAGVFQGNFSHFLSRCRYEWKP